MEQSHEPLPRTNPWRVKHSGECLRCGRQLHVGEPAVYESRLRRIRCIECPTSGHVETSERPTVEGGVAGRSARAQYKRLREARSERLRNRLGKRLGGLVVAATPEPQDIRSWESGATGEEAVGAMLDGLAGCRTLHDRRVPGSRANIDHILVAPSGLFVIDAKRHEGMVRVRDRGPLWRTELRLYVGSRDRSRLADGVRWQVDRVGEALSGAGSTPPPRVVGVLCFVGSSWPLFRPPNEFQGIKLESPRSLERLVAAMSAEPLVDVDYWSRLLVNALPPR